MTDRRAALVLWSLSSLWAPSLGCGDDDAPAVTEEAAPPPPRGLFPLTPGDRWRIESGPAGTPQNTGVTGVDSAGFAVVHGTGHALAERYRATDREVSLVDPSGQVLVPLLRAPLRAGERWEYVMPSDGGPVTCVVEVRDTEASEQIGGLEVDGCVDVRRRCAHPEGGPFGEATVHSTHEVYCPALGRVVVRDRFRPPPPPGLLPAERTERVVGYRVAGAPRWPSPETFDCRSFILLPSDVQAACGTSVAPREPVAGESGDGRCTYRYRSPEGEFEISAERHDEPPSSQALDSLLDLPDDVGSQAHEGARFATADEEIRFALAEGRVIVRGRAAEATCPEQSAARLVPLLRSLLR